MLTIEKAKAIMKAGLGKAELEFATSVTAPLYWVTRKPDRTLEVHNGSAFFLDTGEALFGVTAAHVILAVQEARRALTEISCQLGRDLVFDPDDKNPIIDLHNDIDIATFRISDAEIRSIGKTVLTGYQRSWPPRPPQQDCGIYYSGFAGIATLWLSPREISFGAVAGSGVASSVSETDVSTLVEREHLLDVMGTGLPPENFNFGGISGGPMLTVIEHRGLRSWQLAGVIYQGPNTSNDPEQAIAGLEIIRTRRAHFILADGKLDHRRWATLRPGVVP